MAGLPPPGWFGPSGAIAGAMPPMLAVPTNPAPRRFPGHFMPHRLCNHFTAHGWCRKAETCTFAHGLQELHPDVQMQLAPQLGLVAPQFAMKGKGKGMVKGFGKVLQPMMPDGEQLAAGYDFAEAAAAMAAAQEAAAAAGSEANFHFNVGAQPFVPVMMPEEAVAGGMTTGDEGEDSGAAEDHSGTDDGRADSSSPGRRRPQPAPLQLDDSPGAPTRTIPAPSTVPFVFSSAAGVLGRTVTQVLAQPLISPMHVHTRLFTPHVAGRQPLSSPKTILLSPTHGLGASVSTVAHAIPAMPAVVRDVAGVPSPTGAAVPVPMQTPTRGATTMVLRSPAGMPWPGSPTTVVMSPTSPVPISRGMLLQARSVVQRAEQGPPGLSHFAPTPTTRASRLGFRYPQPGLLATVSTAVPTTVPAHVVAKAKAVVRPTPPAQ